MCSCGTHALYAAAAIMVRSDGATIAVTKKAAAIRDSDGRFSGAAFPQIADLRRDSPQDKRIFTINLPGQSLDHPDLELATQDLQHRFPIDPHRVCLEITETNVIANMGRALELMDQLRRGDRARGNLSADYRHGDRLRPGLPPGDARPRGIQTGRVERRRARSQSPARPAALMPGDQSQRSG